MVREVTDWANLQRSSHFKDAVTSLINSGTYILKNPEISGIAITRYVISWMSVGNVGQSDEQILPCLQTQLLKKCPVRGPFGITELSLLAHWGHLLSSALFQLLTALPDCRHKVWESIHNFDDFDNFDNFALMLTAVRTYKPLSIWNLMYTHTLTRDLKR